MFSYLYYKLFNNSFDRHSIIGHCNDIRTILFIMNRFTNIPLNTTKVVNVYDYDDSYRNIDKLILYVTDDEWNELLAIINERHPDMHIRAQ